MIEGWPIERDAAIIRRYIEPRVTKPQLGVDVR